MLYGNSLRPRGSCHVRLTYLPYLLTYSGLEAAAVGKSTVGKSTRRHGRTPPLSSAAGWPPPAIDALQDRYLAELTLLDVPSA